MKVCVGYRVGESIMTAGIRQGGMWTWEEWRWRQGSPVSWALVLINWLWCLLCPVIPLVGGLWGGGGTFIICTKESICQDLNCSGLLGLMNRGPLSLPSPLPTSWHTQTHTPGRLRLDINPQERQLERGRASRSDQSTISPSIMSVNTNFDFAVGTFSLCR